MSHSFESPGRVPQVRFWWTHQRRGSRPDPPLPLQPAICVIIAATCSVSLSAYVGASLDLLNGGIVEFTGIGIPGVNVISLLNTSGLSLGQATSVNTLHPTKMGLDVAAAGTILQSDNVFTRNDFAFLRPLRGRGKDERQQGCQSGSELAEVDHFESFDGMFWRIDQRTDDQKGTSTASSSLWDLYIHRGMVVPFVIFRDYIDDGQGLWASWTAMIDKLQ